MAPGRRFPLAPAPLVLMLLAAGCIAPGTGDRLDSAGGASGGFSDTHVFAGAYDTTGPFSQPLHPGPYALMEPEIASIPSELDGAAIQMGIARPDVPEGQRVPLLVVASPYYSPMTPERMKGDAPPDSMFPHIRREYQIYAENFVPHGYAVAMVAVRGSADSGGCSDVFGPTEKADVNQAVTWLATRPWASGNVGMAGLSYSASTPWQVAAAGNPHLKTIVSAAGISDFYGFIYQNGTVNPGGTGAFFVTYYPLGFYHNNPTNGRRPENTAAGVACPEAWNGLAESLKATTLLERNDFWDARNHRPGVEENYRGSILLVQGFEDWRVNPAQQYPWVNELADRGIVVKHLLGQWGHAMPDFKSTGENRRWDWAEILLHWFDYWLKSDQTVDLGPRAQVQDSAGAWRSETAWPPTDATPRSFHLSPGGKLTPEPVAGSETAPVAPETTQEFLLGARLVDEETPCPACPRFKSAPFDREFRFAGRPTVHLTVTPTGPGGHVTTLLYSATGEGERLVGRGQIDLRVADGRDAPDVVVPNAPLIARLQLEPLDVVVPAGGRLVLQLTQGAYGERQPSLPTYPVQVEVGRDASVLTVHAFERGPEAFFAPPS